jgi:hypothetical protein
MYTDADCCSRRLGCCSFGIGRIVQVLRCSGVQRSACLMYTLQECLMDAVCSGSFLSLPLEIAITSVGQGSQLHLAECSGRCRRAAASPSRVHMWGCDTFHSRVMRQYRSTNFKHGLSCVLKSSCQSRAELPRRPISNLGTFVIHQVIRTLCEGCCTQTQTTSMSWVSKKRSSMRSTSVSSGVPQIR